ncbi:MAG TPA: succinate dehydrogenase/fumarate reductase iron-sulfur subunit [Candidatus Dormibacteraeota bacterium]|nr:succinate dehydrogenase/fumarate reductase iron-sulfur subunit [Candidatus Dormibacteraeota bacterium]
MAQAMNVSDLQLSIWRGTPAGGELVSYRVPVREGMVVLDAVLWVQANLASDLAVRWNCKAAKCGSCSAEINGFPRLMCKTPIAEYGDRLTVTPMKTFPLIKDLVTDVSWNYEVNKTIPPFTPSDKDATSSEPWRMQQKDVERSMEFRKCIECFLCQDVCHVLREHDSKSVFYGPRFLIRIASLEMHPKDVLDRTALVKEKAGVGYCNITKCCTEVCPEHIKITDNAIIPLKERMDDRYFDPIQSLLRRFRAGPKRLQT